VYLNGESESSTDDYAELSAAAQKDSVYADADPSHAHGNGGECVESHTEREDNRGRGKKERGENKGKKGKMGRERR